MNKKCCGCGAILQSEIIDGVGYVPKEKYDDAVYCQKCYKIKYYNQKSVTKLDDINNKILDRINGKKSFVYFLIDFINIFQEIFDVYNKIKVDN